MKEFGNIIDNFYDARGRVIKMWNNIAGLGWKVTKYEYNSQNQVTELIYQSGYSDTKTFKYNYDYAGRLLNTSINYIPQDSPEHFIVFNSYTYNQNSQINTSKLDPINLTHTYSYDSRNRITNYAYKQKLNDLEHINGVTQKSKMGVLSISNFVITFTSFNEYYEILNNLIVKLDPIII